MNEEKYFWNFTQKIGLTGSIYFTMAITVERYLTVCHPFYKLSHEWPAKYYIIPIFTFSFVYNIPKFFELKTHYPVNHSNSTEASNHSTVVPDTVYDEIYYNDTDSEAELYDYGILPTELRLNQTYYQVSLLKNNFTSGETARVQSFQKSGW